MTGVQPVTPSMADASRTWALSGFGKPCDSTLVPANAIACLISALQQVQRLSQDNRIKQRRAWLLLGWVAAERSCPCNIDYNIVICALQAALLPGRWWWFGKLRRKQNKRRIKLNSARLYFKRTAAGRLSLGLNITTLTIALTPESVERYRKPNKTKK
ncbi:hypothetical protein J6590_071885 [Homalodisca vitripennis]|nr:hypothetical protein J6590_071885 [Homalodisca vitripennis]